MTKRFMRLSAQICFVAIALMMMLAPATAQIACDAGQVTINSVTSVSGETYDPLDITDKEVSFQIIVQNNGAQECQLYFAACVSESDAKLEPQEKISYDIMRLDGGGNSSLTNTGALCPVNGAALSKVNDTISAGQTKTFSNFLVAMSAGQFVEAVIHQEDGGLEIGIYSRVDGGTAAEDVQLDSRAFAISNIQVAQASEFPDAPTNSSGSGGVTYAPGGIGGGTISFSAVLNSLDATLDAGSMTLTYVGARTNYQSFVSVKTQNGGMTRQVGVTPVAGSGAFLDRIDYTVEADFCGAGTQITTSGIGNQSSNSQCTVNGLNQTDLVVTVSTADGSTPLLAGTYSDVLTIQIGSQL